MLRAFRRRGLLDEDVVSDMLAWQANGGFSVDASVRVEGEDRAGVERLVRYCARGPLALERLHELAFDQTPAFDPTDPEPVPDFDFDQSLPDIWDD